MDEPNLYPVPLNVVPPCLPKLKLPPLKPEESGASTDHYTDENKVDIESSTWIKTVRQKVNEARPKVNTDGPCTILQFPGSSIRRRDNDDKVYTPVIATIGPYHYFPSQRGMARAMHEHKWRCVRYLLSRHHSRDRASRLLDQCLATLKGLDGDVRNCYGGILNHFDPPKLASVMLMDGCFIIHLMLKQVENEIVDNETEEVVESQRVNESEEVDKGKEKVTEEEEEKVELEMGKGEEEAGGPLIGMLWIWNLVVFDLLKFDNQIPFFIIQTIFDIVKTPRDRDLDLVDLGLRLFRDIHPQASKVFSKQPTTQIHHLLHLFHLSLVPYKHKSLASSSPAWIPRTTELKRAGVKFVKKVAYESFLDVTYNDGTLEIPPLEVYDYSNSLFRNLIAYEQCFPDVGKYVTNYAAFMGRIVVAAEDARLLNSAGILANRIGTDEAVVDLFNQHSSRLYYASRENYLADVFDGIREYHGSNWSRWRARFITAEDFSSRWSVVALLFAVTMIFLIVEQFFAVFSYFRPLHDDP